MQRRQVLSRRPVDHAHSPNRGGVSIKRSVILVVLAVFSIGMLAGCNTVKGAGKDIKGAGEKIEDAAKK